MPLLGQPTGVPSGTISIWTGLINTIPAGWVLCDGNNGTPDLRSVFPKCVPNEFTEPGSLGGTETVTLTEAQMPSHRHSFSVPNHEHDGQDNSEATTGSPVSIALVGKSFGIGDFEIDISSTHLVSGMTSTGSGLPHNNIPRCMDVLYIQRL